MTLTPTEIKLVKFLAVEGMGWKAVVCDDCTMLKRPLSDGRWVEVIWNPLTDGNDMLAMIEAMEGKGFLYQINTWPTEDTPCGKTVDIWYPRNGGNPKRVYAGDTKTAVCQAAYKALTAQKESQDD